MSAMHEGESESEVPAGDEPEMTPESIEEAEKWAARSSRDLEKLFKFVYGHRVRYDEIGAQGIVGPAGWANVLQLGRVEYFRNLGLFIEGGTAPFQAMARKVTSDHIAMAKFDQPLIVRMRCSQLGETSLKLETLVDSSEGLRVAGAEVVMVCVEVESLRTIPWPIAVRERIQEFEGEALLVTG